MVSRLVVASHNPGKVREIRDLLAPFGVDTTSVADLGLPVPDETEATFEGNAALKAKAAAEGAQSPALADDSGLCVAALDGAPGVYSADWAETGEGSRDFSAAMAKVEAALADAGARDLSATFVCVLALARPGGAMDLYRGEVAGRLVFPARGANGFGYDPIFLPKGEAETFGEMDPARKHAMSHRADAFAKLVAAQFPTS